jgi:glycosyltransferase involved in cell wall biosynthesis
VVLFVGRLIPRKGLKYLLETAVTILQENKQAAFVIVGNGPLRKSLGMELERLNISKYFKFLGDVKDEDLPSIYNCSDVFVLPSVQEGQGIALLEAQASAKPVTAFNVSGIPETLVEGTSGFLVEKGNSEALAQVILNLLSNRNLREKMGTKGREFILRNFTWDICASKMLSIYKQELET